MGSTLRRTVELFPAPPFPGRHLVPGPGQRAGLRPILALSTLILVLLLSSCQGSAGSSVLELRLGHVAPPGSLVARSAEEFARRANEQLTGRAHVTVFGSSQLGSDEVLMIKLRLGTVDFALPSTIMSSVVDAFGFFEMPYLVEDREHMKRIEEKIFWPALGPLAEERGFRVLALWENGFRHITNNTRPIIKPGDLHGIKLRTPKGRWRVELFQIFGAHPTPMSLSEVFVALQTGVLDGQENPLAQIHSSKFQEVQDYLSLTGHVYSPAFLTVGTDKWSQRPADIRGTLEQVARQMQQYVYTTAQQMDEDLLREMKASGMAVNQADRDSFFQASQAIYRQFGQAVPGGEQWIETALALAHD